MIHEYAILPGVFVEANYSSPDACDFSLRWLKSGLLRGGVVRNLHGGGWEDFLKESGFNIHMRAKELLKKLIQQGRLDSAFKELSERPTSDEEWLDEAARSHVRMGLNGIIAVKSFKNRAEHRANELISAIENLDACSGWCGHRGSESILRDGGAYLSSLGRLLRTSRSVMLIDPHLDPSENRYRVVRELLNECRHCSTRPSAEIHRVVYKGTGSARQFPDWESIFRQHYGSLDVSVTRGAF